MSNFQTLSFLDFKMLTILFSQCLGGYFTVFEVLVRVPLKYVKGYKKLFGNTVENSKGTIKDSIR